MKESRRCSYEGKLEEDPDSQVKKMPCNSIQVSLSGCPGSDEDEDGQILTLVTNKFKFRSSTYRLWKGKVKMAEGDLTDKVVVHRPAAPVEKNHGPRPDISGVPLPEISDKTVIDSPFVLPGVPGKASHTEVEYGEDYQEATPELKGEGVYELGDLDYKDFNELHKKTMKHWKEQQTKNKEKLAKILESKDDVLIHEHSMQRRPTKGLPELYQRPTIEICVITDPFLFDLVGNLFYLNTDKDVNAKIFKIVHKTLMGAETFLKHKSISKIKGGFQLKLNGIRVLKDWGHLDKMKTRKNLQDVLFDLGDYMQARIRLYSSDIFSDSGYKQ